MHPPTVGADSIRPQGWKIELSVEWNQFPVTVLGFPRGEAGFFGNWHFGTDWQKRLMRGGDRVDDECGWMSGKCSGLYHSTGKSETFSYRCPSSVTFIGSEEPLKAPASPGGSQGVVAVSFNHSTDGSIPSGCGRMLSAPTGVRANRRGYCNTFFKSSMTAWVCISAPSVVRWLSVP